MVETMPVSADHNHMVSGPCQCVELLTMQPSHSEMAGLKVKSHLESLMGTDVIKLNDRQYMLTLQNNLKKEYDITMDKLEEQRSDRERRRQRRLYIEGLQDLPNLDVKDKSATNPRSKTAGSTPSQTSNSRHDKLSYKDDEENTFINRPAGLTPHPSSRKKLKDVKSRRPTKYVKDEKGVEDEENQDDTSTTKATAGYKADEENDTTQRGQLLKQLKQQSSVRGLYATADMVLSAPVTEIRTQSAAGSPHGSIRLGGTDSPLRKKHLSTELADSAAHDEQTPATTQQDPEDNQEAEHVPAAEDSQQEEQN